MQYKGQTKVFLFSALINDTGHEKIEGLWLHLYVYTRILQPQETRQIIWHLFCHANNSIPPPLKKKRDRTTHSLEKEKKKVANSRLIH